ncbi:MAG: 16S rRNA (guanine(966)-N(2))-methyltransferase RsmD [Firmicutes bacterium]|nr:16S rRNA (guanine(966)-N(2))-methyltransferase RsmD [Bacillota bacterium]
MRVISGKAKGKKLLAPEGLHTRPVTDQIKQAIFNSWQFKVPGSKFLDLFSGSGSMGIEAISRGALKTTLVDNDRNAVDIIRTNIQNCHFEKSSYNLLQADVFKVIDQMEAKGEQFDIIYLDPPYTVDEIFVPVMEAIGKTHILKEDGILAIRTKKEKELDDEFGYLEKIRMKKYGISMVHYYENKVD